MTLTMPTAQDTPTTNPVRLAHAHPRHHDPEPGCIAPCGYVWRNTPQDQGVAKDAPCAECMNIHLGGLLTPEHMCQGPA